MCERTHANVRPAMQLAIAGTFEEINRAVAYHQLILALGERWFSHRISYGTYMLKHRRLLARMKRYGIVQLR